MDDESKILRRTGDGWPGVTPERYGSPAGRFHGVTRHVLLGEREGEAGLKFVTRYFTIEAGGCSSLERHHHPHSVFILHGAGRVILDGKVHDLEPLDCVYVAPDSLHQFHAAGAEPLGFLCIVDRERDTGRPPDEDELAALQRDSAIAPLLGR